MLRHLCGLRNIYTHIKICYQLVEYNYAWGNDIAPSFPYRVSGTVAFFGKLFIQAFISIRSAAEEGHSDGLGLMGEGGEYDSGFERDAVDGLQSK